MATGALHPIEVRVLGALKDGGWVDFDSLLSGGLLPDQVRRSIEWLLSKGFIDVEQNTLAKLVLLIPTAPELLLLRRLKEAGRPVPLSDLKKDFKSQDEFSAALGRARESSWIKVESSAVGSFVSILDADGAAKLERLLAHLARGAEEDALPEELRPLLPDLIKRGIVQKTEEKSTRVRITRDGLAALEAAEGGRVERLTPDLLATGRWRGKELRPIDVRAPAPRFYPGRRHPVNEFIEEVKEAYISMGFTEIEGAAIQPALWNFDALFTPQDHPGRELQDTFYLMSMEDDSIKREGVVDRIASTHEDGWRTGSRGWQYRWSTEEARRLVLRTHNTVLTVRALESEKEDLRVFALGKVYRNESLDYKHLAEFHQMDGAIMGDGLNTRHLMGFLTGFYRKLGMSEVKLWPSYFPYTEPSLQVVGYSDLAKDWIELGGSGVFRPEVTWPLGVKKPVLAWGLGIERLILLRLGLDDLRVLYDNDLGWLRRRATTSIAGSQTLQG
ncbi:MAG: phenylalanine--tRNA ligase subunit alpha [Thaumarchaeota archaeon]|nr:MAG: phenylalanine--tRNA ligase subunit alpha [Nitrososphaerota archaeon]